MALSNSVVGYQICRSGVVAKVFVTGRKNTKQTTTSNAFCSFGCFSLVPSWPSCNVAANQAEAMAARNSREKVANR